MKSNTAHRTHTELSLKGRTAIVVVFLVWLWASHLPFPPGSDFVFKVGYAASYAWNALAHLFT